MTAARLAPNYAKQSPREIREAKQVRHDFVCESCGEEWDTPAHMFWLCRMYCVCGEVVEAK